MDWGEILLIVVCVWGTIGTLRVVFGPYKGFGDAVMRFLLLDWIGGIFEGLGDIFEDIDFPDIDFD